MNKMFAVLISVVVITFAWTNLGLAQDVGQLTDQFYGGLADILEGNMDQPKQCIQEAERYYQQNQATIKKIQAAAEKAMAQAAPMMQQMMDQYMSMSEEELQAMAQKQEAVQMPGPTQQTPGMDRYIKLMEDFTMKHPLEAMQLSMMAMQLIPTSTQQNLFKQEWMQDAR